MFEAFGQDTQRQRLDLGDGVRLGGGITEDSREFRNLGDPPAILFPFKFNFEGHTPDSSTSLQA